jgi:predicted transcriptional regulator
MAAKWRDIRNKNLSKEDLAAVDRQVRAELLEMELRELRELAGKTQVEAAEAAMMTQSELSKVELRDDPLVSTLRRYIEALGGKLEVVAVLGNHRVTLRGV